MQERADHQVLVLDAVLDYERGNREQVGDVRDRRALARLRAMDRGGVRDRSVEPIRQLQHAGCPSVPIPR